MLARSPSASAPTATRSSTSTRTPTPGGALRRLHRTARRSASRRGGPLHGANIVQIGLRGTWPTRTTSTGCASGLPLAHDGRDRRARPRRGPRRRARHAAARAPRVYLTVDIDVLDPAFAPGTGTPEPGGLTTRELARALRRVGREIDLCAADVVEVCPPFDPTGSPPWRASGPRSTSSPGWRCAGRVDGAPPRAGRVGAMDGTTRRDFMQRAAAGAALLTLGPLAEAVAAPLPRPPAAGAAQRRPRPGARAGQQRLQRGPRAVQHALRRHPPAGRGQGREQRRRPGRREWAAKYDVPLVARSGGNAYNGSSTSNIAVVVDVGGLTTVAVDGGNVVIGPGGRLLPTQARLARRGPHLSRPARARTSPSAATPRRRDGALRPRGRPGAGPHHRDPPSSPPTAASAA